MKLAIYCADIGSVPNKRFGWARIDPSEPTLKVIGAEPRSSTW